MAKFSVVIDRLVRRMTGAVEAGACVPNQGCCCSSGHPYYAYNCYGNCVKEAVTCGCV